MTAHRLATGHICALLALPEDVDTTAARTAAAALPGGWALEPIAEGPTDVEVTVGAPDVTADTHTVRVRLPRSVADSDTLAYVTYTALERTRQQQRMATVHATALHTRDGRAVLLLGAKGAGKTSTALALATRGWMHAGDDLVVLGERGEGTVSVWPGKPTAAVRDPARPLAPKPQRALEPFAADPAPLVWVVRMAVHPTLTTATLTAGAPLSVNEKLRLHENLARYISGLPTPVGGVEAVPYGPVWPLDTPALARWRSHLITRLATCRFNYLYAPGPEVAADLLTNEADAG
jgi:non-ribosomal peptide synthetase component F